MNAKKQQLPVEPLTAEAWARVEASVYAELEAGGATEPQRIEAGAKRRVAGVAMIVAATMAAAAAAFFVTRTSLNSNEGAREAQNTIPTVQQGETAAPQPSRIVTTTGPTRASVGDASVDVAEASAMFVTGNARDGFVVLLEKGSAEFSVPPRRGRPDFRVQAGEVLVEVVGTRFTVSRETDRVTVTVVHGTVRVVSNGIETFVRGGERWPAEEATETKSPVPTDHRDETKPTARQERQRNAGAEERAAHQVAMGDGEQTRFERASRLEAHEPAAALAIYGELARGTGAWAANALYAAGRLELERGQKAEATKHLEAYLARFPHGANTADVKALLGNKE